jgi:hypothetical protein
MNTQRIQTMKIEQSYRTAVGCRAAGDKYVARPKVRFAPEEVIIHVA